jgi:hypothetical protein
MTVDALTSTDVSCNGEANGTATVSVSGGITPYTYQWSTGSTDTNTISDLQVYTVTVKDALNKVITSTFTVNEPSLL